MLGEQNIHFLTRVPNMYRVQKCAPSSHAPAKPQQLGYINYSSKKVTGLFDSKGKVNFKQEKMTSLLNINLFKKHRYHRFSSKVKGWAFYPFFFWGKSALRNFHTVKKKNGLNTIENVNLYTESHTCTTFYFIYTICKV